MAMAATATMTSQRCSMAKRMMRSNMGDSGSVRMLGRRFAQFGLQQEGAVLDVVLSGLQSGGDFGGLTVRTPQLNALGLVAPLRRNEDHVVLAIRALDALGVHCDAKL